MIIIRLDFFSLVERNCRKIAQSRGTVVSRRILFTKPGPHGVRVFFSTLDIKSDGVRATSVTSGWRIGVRTQEIRQFPARARSCLHLIGAPVTSSPGGGGVLGALFRARRPSHADRSMRPSCTSPLSNASPFFETHVRFVHLPKNHPPLHSEISVLPFSSLYDSKDVSVLQGEALLSEDLFQSFVLVASKATLLVQLVTILYSICMFGIIIIMIIEI